MNDYPDDAPPSDAAGTDVDPLVITPDMPDHHRRYLERYHREQLATAAALAAAAPELEHLAPNVLGWVRVSLQRPDGTVVAVAATATPLVPGLSAFTPLRLPDGSPFVLYEGPLLLHVQGSTAP